MRQVRAIHRMKFTVSASLISICLGFGSPSPAQNKPSPEITVAAAADLSSALQDLASRYERKTGVKVKLSFGASGALTQQIENGAPFDAFFSADMDYPRQLIAQGQADAGSLTRYAVGKVVLWAPAGSSLDLQHQKMAALLDPAVKKISIANPQHAPYGRAAVAAMKHAGVYEKVSDRLVIGENVAQAAQFVESGNAQIGLIALAHAQAPAMKGKGSYWEVPADMYPALDQGVVVVSRSRNKSAATEFVRFIATDEAVQILRSYGFTVPSGN